MSDSRTKQLANGEKIEGLFALYDELDAIKEKASDAINIAKQWKDRETTITRKDGKVSKLKEALLWDEVRVVGDQTEAYEFLKSKYPEAFERSDEVTKKAYEIDQYAVIHFGIHSDKVTLRDIIKLIQMLQKK